MSSTTVQPTTTIGALATDWAPRVLSIVRIVVALLFLEHGLQKMLGFNATGVQPGLFSLIWFAGIIELVGSVLLLIGLFSRPIAFLMSGEMAIAYWMVHAPKSPFPILNGGDAPILFCFVFLYLAVAGGGVWSVDAARNRI